VTTWARTPTGRSLLLLAALVLVWGCHWVVAKIGLGIIPPFTYAALRLVTGIAVLAILMQGAGRLRPPQRSDVPIVLSYGVLSIALGIGLMNLALPFVPAGRSSILAYTLPLWVVPIVAIVARAWPTRAEVAGLLLGLLGLALLLNPLAIDWSSTDVLVGSALLLLGALTGAMALVHVRAHRWAGTPFDVQVWQLLVAFVPMLVLAVLLELDRWASIDWDVGAVLVILYSGPLATAFAFWASQSIVRALGPMTTSIAYLAVPVVGILAGAAVLGETVGILDILGFLVTSAGIVVVLLARRGSQGEASTRATQAEPGFEAMLADGAELTEPAALRQ
jgi:drug/metabolite transporter (DMT)-like permease